MKRTQNLLALLLCLCCLLSSLAFAGAAKGEIRNVIFMIGDGMGYNHLKLAEEQGYEIFMDDAPDLFGWSRTRSANKKVTDSAAGATALACGVRTKNHMVAVYPQSLKRSFVQPRSLTENAILHEMKTGIVTTDLTTGATPAGFSVHTLHRGNTEDIAAQQVASSIDLLWGSDVEAAARTSAEEAGFTYVTNRAEMLKLTPGERSFGQFADELWKATLPENDPSLSEMTEKAISLLSSGNENGFFLMVEGAHIDKKADDSQDGLVDYPEKISDVCTAVQTFDAAVRAAVDFAQKDGHTLVFITADHETGDLRYEEETGRMTFHSASHSSANVPVFIYGAGDLFENGAEMDNRDIPNLVAESLGWSERFPIEDPVDDGAEEAQTEQPPENEGNFLLRTWHRIKGFFVNLGKSVRGVAWKVWKWGEAIFVKQSQK